MRRVRARRARGDSGVVLVEAALIFPILIVLAFGTVEFGLGWRDSMTVSTGLRAASRVGANIGGEVLDTDRRLADYTLLQNIKAGFADVGLTNVQKIVVFRATTNATVDPACTSMAAGSGQTGTRACNVYNAASLSLPVTSFNGITSGACSSTSVDRFFCPLTRENRLSVGPDYIGVWVQVRHQSLTGLFGSGMTINDTAITRIEPAGG
jgi:Flp pilus assembly protein TadG